MTRVSEKSFVPAKIRKCHSAPVGVLTKVLAIFELLDRSPGGLQLRYISEQTGFNKSTTYRFLAHLEQAGYLVRDLTGAYLIGPRLVRLGTDSTYQATIRKISRPIMETLWSKTEETVNLGVLDRGEVLYLDVIESPHHFRLSSQAGMRRPLNCTALGKSLLAWMPPSTRDDLLAGYRVDKRTQHSIANPMELLAELGRIQRRGYAIDNEEVEAGACCVAAPVFDSSGQVTASMSVSGPVTRMNRARTSEIAIVLKAATDEISGQLGYSESLRRGSGRMEFAQ